jgi:ankyrin repeat protein
MQKLFLAIQHQRNDEARDLIYNGGIDVSKNGDGGYGPVHIACKYNNRFVLDLLLSRGVHIEMLDANGNSTLHYAAKAGVIDICKLLIEKGCSAARRNNQQQTPYDASQNHIVRQYLLPIQLKAEAQDPNQPVQLGISTEMSYSSTAFQAPMPMAMPPPVAHHPYGNTLLHCCPTPSVVTHFLLLQ